MNEALIDAPLVSHDITSCCIKYKMSLSSFESQNVSVKLTVAPATRRSRLMT